MRSPIEIDRMEQYVVEMQAKAHRKEITEEHLNEIQRDRGINGVAILHEISTLVQTWCHPIDIMHVLMVQKAGYIGSFHQGREKKFSTTDKEAFVENNPNASEVETYKKFGHILSDVQVKAIDEIYKKLPFTIPPKLARSPRPFSQIKNCKAVERKELIVLLRVPCKHGIMNDEQLLLICKLSSIFEKGGRDRLGEM